MRIQPIHIVLLILVIVLVFGASRLPDIARNLGKSAKILKEEVKDLRGDEPTTPGTPPQAQQTSGQQQPYVQQQPYPQDQPPAAGPYAPGGTATPGVTSPTDAPTTNPAGTPTEWPPGSSQR
ncbi:hypothetical protein C8046_08785 [Serinibacter arcticus]|uniref:Sec-independent protein translocase protein TatA n=1 Tax=Serinibacter arcticus TaxID=1655435 RepID=A0A2U1ZUR2_9MICO|nr:Sec-independent protein translocase subunit TatA [Serinibacter arcticus]PWD50725.1 hypothetical protein C8046_08785 [Serinibacter arcticus]